MEEGVMVDFSLLTRRDRIGRMLDAAAKAGLVPKEKWSKLTFEKAKELFPSLAEQRGSGSMHDAAFHYATIVIAPSDEQSLVAAERAVGAATYAYACSLAQDHLENLFRGLKENSRGG